MFVYWQVIFLVLDICVKNIVFNYLFEYDFIEDFFILIFYWLYVFEEERGDIVDVFCEVILCIGIIQLFICYYMFKEEWQVYRFFVCYII